MRRRQFHFHRRKRPRLAFRERPLLYAHQQHAATALDPAVAAPPMAVPPRLADAANATEAGVAPPQVAHLEPAVAAQPRLRAHAANAMEPGVALPQVAREHAHAHDSAQFNEYR